MARESKTGISVESILQEDLYGVLLKARGESQSLSPAKIARELFAAEDFYERDLQIRFSPTRVFSDVDGRAYLRDEAMHVSDFDELRDIDEPAYDYDGSMWAYERWGCISLNYFPVRSVQRVVFTWPGAVKIWSVPPEWLGVDKRYGWLQIRPSSGQAVLMNFTNYLLGVIGAGRGIPQSIYIDYITGFTPELLEHHHQDLLRGVRLQATLAVFGIAANAAAPGGAGNLSLSIDGLSRSKGFSGKYGAYSGAIELALAQEQSIRDSWKQRERGIPMGILRAG